MKNLLFAVAAAVTSHKVTPTAVVEVFTIWITGIIPLLFDNMLPESGLTSTVMWLRDQDLCAVQRVRSRVC